LSRAIAARRGVSDKSPDRRSEKIKAALATRFIPEVTQEFLAGLPVVRPFRGISATLLF